MFTYLLYYQYLISFIKVVTFIMNMLQVYFTFSIKRGRPRKNLAGSTPTPVPQTVDVTCNVTQTRGRRKRQLSNHNVNNENNNDKIIEPTTNGGDLKGEEEEIDEEQEEKIRMNEEVRMELGGDDLERKMTYATVEKTAGGWLCTICGKVSSAKHNLLGEWSTLYRCD